jgi:hypothetical protein
MKIIAVSSIVICAIIGCAAGRASLRNVPLDTHFQLRPGEEVRVDERIMVGFDSVAEETRCPVGVECVWEGNARTQMVYQAPDHRGVTFFLNTSSRYNRDTTIEGYTIRLVDLYPHRLNNHQMVRSDYTVEMIVSKQP